MQRSVRPVRVEMLYILAQHDVEVVGSGEEEVVEAFPAQGADEAFRDRIRAGCSVRMMRMSAPAKTALNAAVTAVTAAGWSAPGRPG